MIIYINTFKVKVYLTVKRLNYKKCCCPKGHIVGEFCKVDNI